MADSGSDPAKEASAPGGDGGPKPPRVTQKINRGTPPRLNERIDGSISEPDPSSAPEETHAAEPMVRSTPPNGRAEAADLSETLKQLVVESMSSAIAELKEELTREISRSFDDAHRPADEAL